MSAEKRSVSAPSELFERAVARQKDLGYSTFSDYIQALIRADTMQGGGHVRAVEGEVSYLQDAPAPVPKKDRLFGRNG